MQELALDSDVAATDLKSCLEDLTKRILVVLGDKHGESHFEQHLSAVADDEATLVSEVSDVRRAVADAEGATRNVAELATGIAANVQFQDITRQATQQVQRALERLAGQSELLLAYVGGTADAEDVQERRNGLDDMVSEYVIQRQRATHAEAAFGDASIAADSGQAIELF